MEIVAVFFVVLVLFMGVKNIGTKDRRRLQDPVSFIEPNPTEIYNMNDHLPEKEPVIIVGDPLALSAGTSAFVINVKDQVNKTEK